MSDLAMRCKLVLHELFEHPHANGEDGEVCYKARFGAVWEGDTGTQLTENAAFGKMTPQAEFTCIIKNPHVVDTLKRNGEGRAYYMEFYAAPEDKQPSGWPVR